MSDCHGIADSCCGEFKGSVRKWGALPPLSFFIFSLPLDVRYAAGAAASAITVRGAGFPKSGQCNSNDFHNLYPSAFRYVRFSRSFSPLPPVPCAYGFPRLWRTACAASLASRPSSAWAEASAFGAAHFSTAELPGAASFAQVQAVMEQEASCAANAAATTARAAFFAIANVFFIYSLPFRVRGRTVSLGRVSAARRKIMQNRRHEKASPSFFFECLRLTDGCKEPHACRPEGD